MYENLYIKKIKLSIRIVQEETDPLRLAVAQWDAADCCSPAQPPAQPSASTFLINESVCSNTSGGCPMCQDVRESESESGSVAEGVQSFRSVQSFGDSNYFEVLSSGDDELTDAQPIDHLDVGSNRLSGTEPGSVMVSEVSTVSRPIVSGDLLVSGVSVVSSPEVSGSLPRLGKRLWDRSRSPHRPKSCSPARSSQSSPVLSSQSSSAVQSSQSSPVMSSQSSQSSPVMSSPSSQSSPVMSTQSSQSSPVTSRELHPCSVVTVTKGTPQSSCPTVGALRRSKV